MRNDPSGMNQLQSILNADKVFKVRLQLAVLLHAQKFQLVDDSMHTRCKVPFCKTGRDVWRHIQSCTVDSDCSEPKCKVSRQILAHWDLCSKNQLYCKVCTPLKTMKFGKSKRIEIPDCHTARNLISHFKQCAAFDCERCESVNELKRKVCGSRALMKQKVNHSALLKHCCRCLDRQCNNSMCLKMKRVRTHTNICRCNTSDSLICQEIATFCLNHCISCTEKDCILSGS